MLSMDVLGVVGVLAGCDIISRLVVHLYYSDHDRVLRICLLAPRDLPRSGYYKRFDALLAPLPFLWAWMEIVVAVLLARALGGTFWWLVAIVVIGGRFRALQEFGHNAVHYALCRSHAWQWGLSDYFFQFPTFKRDMHSREITHTKEHHKNPNHETLDPNRARIRDGGMTYPMTPRQFYLRLLYPLSLRGLKVTIQTMWKNSMLNHSRFTLMLRLVSIASAAALFYSLAGWKGIALGWFVPLLTTNPLFAWLSILTEHRWFVSGKPVGRLETEYLAGRPTDYHGLSGALVRALISPTSDAYHLAHSLYPGVRWNHLPRIDRALKVMDGRYTAHASEGLLFSSDDIPSALSELRERLTGSETVRLNSASSKAPI
jgi:fatty acid desaturase